MAAKGTCHCDVPTGDRCRGAHKIHRETRVNFPKNQGLILAFVNLKEIQLIRNILFIWKYFTIPRVSQVGPVILRRPKAWDMGNIPMVLQQRNLRDQHNIGWYRLYGCMWCSDFLIGSLTWACWHVIICWKVLAQIWWKLHHGQEQERWDQTYRTRLDVFFPVSDAKNIPKLLNVSCLWYRWPFFFVL